MAYIQMNFFSKTLMRQVPVNVILPVDKLLWPGMPVREDKPYKTLYLLHGIFGNYTDWVVGSRIQRYAEENDLVVIMPSGDNGFYIDQPLTHNFYGEFVGKELVEITRKMFPLSHKREDTYIGGLSMGGYGAIRNGLKYHDTFGAIIALSAAIHMDGFQKCTNEAPIFFERRDYVEELFGDLDKLSESDKDPKYLVEQLIKEKAQIPAIYMACGKEDSLLSYNQDFVKFLQDKNVTVTYEEGPGNHEWDFWDTYIKKGIEWLPLEKTGLGVSSGNVGV